MTTDKTLPVVAWRRPSIYSECLPVFTPLCSEAAEWDEGGHEVAALADHAEASARIAELEAQVRDLTADRDSWANQCSQRVADWDEMRHRAEAAEAQVRELRGGWLPIEQAPLDRDLWLFDRCVEPTQFVGHWRSECGGYWAYSEALVNDVEGCANPTHWQPLPPPPQQQQEERQC